VLLLDETALDIERRTQPFPVPPPEYVHALHQRGDNIMVFRPQISFTLTGLR